MKKTINIEKLERSDITTDRLQETALLLIRELYKRSEVDISEMLEHEGTRADEAKDQKRRDTLKALYLAFEKIPSRGEKWRHRLA